MLKNYFKLAFRHLWKSKGYSAINIIGLAFGLAICLLITLFVADELSYDKFNSKSDRIFRINADFLVNGGNFNERIVPALLGEVLVKDYPQIQSSVRIIGTHDFLVKKGTETLVEPGGCYADATLFDIFSLPMLSGDPKTVLLQPNSLVISESVARKYFGSTDVIGKTLHLDNTADYQITGVIKNMPAQSHIHFNLIKAMSGYPESREANWMSDNFVTYILARPGTTEQNINSFLRVETKKYMDTSLKQMTGSSIADLEKKGEYFRYLAMPLTKIHLYSDLTTEAEPSGNIQYVYIFSIISVFILLIACVNFMNLSTARSAGRAKEVGMRKVLGSQRSSLMAQFLTESMLTSFVALACAVFIAYLLLPFLNQLSSKNIHIQLFSGGWLIFPLLLSAVVVGLLAGIYPAFYLSSFEPIKVLKRKIGHRLQK